jgi:hypothetical protein
VIIGIIGKKRHGKDELTSAIEDQLREGSVEVHVDRLAAPIKTAAVDWFGLSRAQVEGIDYDREQPLEDWDGITVRHILQQIGTEVARSIHPDVWVRHLLSRHQQEKVCQLGQGRSLVTVVPDVRFENEAKAIQAAGGKLVYIVRPSLVNKSDDDHASERDIARVGMVYGDVSVVNDGSLADLQRKGAALAKDIQRWRRAHAQAL